MREHAAAVDVGDQQYRAVDRLGETHVGDVVAAQVDLGRTAGAFHQDDIVLTRQPPVGIQHRHLRGLLVVAVCQRFHVADGVALDDHLRTAIAVRFQQHRVVIGVRFDTAGGGLQRLGTADLAAVGGDGAVQRHVLRLERRHAHALAP